MSLRLNLAALTEGELLAFFGPQEMQARLPEIGRARLDGRPLLAGEIPAQLPLRALEDSGQPLGATPEQTQAIVRQHAQLQEVGALPAGVYFLSPPELYLRTYTLGETALTLQWSESAGRGTKPELRLLTWLRDRASGLACVLTSNATVPPSPTPSEEIDVHLHPDLSVSDLLAKHQQSVSRLGKPMKLSAEQPWQTAWQAAHDLNMAAWKRRGVVVEG